MRKWIQFLTFFSFIFINTIVYSQEKINVGGKQLNFMPPQGFKNGLGDYETINYYTKIYSSPDNVVYGFL